MRALRLNRCVWASVSGELRGRRRLRNPAWSKRSCHPALCVGRSRRRRCCGRTSTAVLWRRNPHERLQQHRGAHWHRLQLRLRRQQLLLRRRKRQGGRLQRSRVRLQQDALAAVHHRPSTSRKAPVQLRHRSLRRLPRCGGLQLLRERRLRHAPQLTPVVLPTLSSLRQPLAARLRRSRAASRERGVGRRASLLKRHVAGQHVVPRGRDTALPKGKVWRIAAERPERAFAHILGDDAPGVGVGHARRAARPHRATANVAAAGTCGLWAVALQVAHLPAGIARGSPTPPSRRLQRLKPVLHLRLLRRVCVAAKGEVLRRLPAVAPAGRVVALALPPAALIPRHHGRGSVARL
jgi:hypothetical protein